MADPGARRAPGPARAGHTGIPTIAAGAAIDRDRVTGGAVATVARDPCRTALAARAAVAIHATEARGTPSAAQAAGTAGAAVAADATTDSGCR